MRRSRCSASSRRRRGGAAERECAPAGGARPRQRSGRPVPPAGGASGRPARHDRLRYRTRRRTRAGVGIGADPARQRAAAGGADAGRERTGSRGAERLAPAGACADPRNHEFADAGGFAVAHRATRCWRNSAPACRPTSAPTWSPRWTRSAGAPTAWSISSAATAACRTCRPRGPSGCASATCSSGCRRWSIRPGARAADAPCSRSNRLRWN